MRRLQKWLRVRHSLQNSFRGDDPGTNEVSEREDAYTRHVCVPLLVVVEEVAAVEVELVAGYLHAWTLLAVSILQHDLNMLHS